MLLHVTWIQNKKTRSNQKVYLILIKKNLVSQWLCMTFSFFNHFYDFQSKDEIESENGESRIELVCTFWWKRILIWLCAGLETNKVFNHILPELLFSLASCAVPISLVGDWRLETFNYVQLEPCFTVTATVVKPKPKNQTTYRLWYD